MRKLIAKNLIFMVIIVVLFSFVLNYTTQATYLRRNMEQESTAIFWQVEQILAQNQLELEQSKQDHTERCLSNAAVVSYMLECDPAIVQDTQALQKIASYLHVDEIHIFDETGTIISGTHPKYFGYSFHSGEQMSFFLPMLEDRSLKLVQEIVPNTADNKPMQYSALWCNEEKYIIQIGMEPLRVLEYTAKNELSYIFSLFPMDDGAVLYAIDPQSGRILASTHKNAVGQVVSSLGLTLEQITQPQSSLRTQVNGEESLCVFQPSGSLILGRVCAMDDLYQTLDRNTAILVLYLLAISALLFICVMYYLNRHIIQGIFNINHKLEAITEGDLDQRVDVNSTPELEQLSGHINTMVESILASTDKISSALDLAHIPVGVYEYSKGMARVRFTTHIPYVLGLSYEQETTLLNDHTLFEAYLDSIRARPLDRDAAIYRLPTAEERFVKLESFPQGSSVLGIVMDMTSEILEKQQLVQERDMDMLTGLYNCRALYAKLDDLFSDPHQLGHAALIMLDADDLKFVNDHYGHQSGDWYLCGIAELLQTISAPHKFFARRGGDEFVVFIYGCATQEELHRYIHELQQTQDNVPIYVESCAEVPLRYSFGYALCPEESTNYPELLKLADERMYQQKRKRKQVNTPV